MHAGKALCQLSHIPSPTLTTPLQPFHTGLLPSIQSSISRWYDFFYIRGDSPWRYVRCIRVENVILSYTQCLGQLQIPTAASKEPPQGNTNDTQPSLFCHLCSWHYGHDLTSCTKRVLSQLLLKQNQASHWAWWLVPVTLAHRRPRRENCYRLEARLGYRKRLCL